MNCHTVSKSCHCMLQHQCTLSIEAQTSSSIETHGGQETCWSIAAACSLSWPKNSLDAPWQDVERQMGRSDPRISQTQLYGRYYMVAISRCGRDLWWPWHALGAWICEVGHGNQKPWTCNQGWHRGDLECRWPKTSWWAWRLGWTFSIKRHP